VGGVEVCYGGDAKLNTLNLKFKDNRPSTDLIAQLRIRERILPLRDAVPG
jgi:hypothetical protein